MKLNKVVAIPALALAAGLGFGLTACGSSASPYAQGKAFATQSQDTASATGYPALQGWCSVNNPGEGSAWESGCEAGYFQKHPDDNQSWGPGSTASAATPAPTTPAPTAPAPTTPAPAPAKTVYVQAPAAPVPAPPAEPAYFTSSAAVVQQFYEDINDGDYSDAWAIGGDNIGGGDYNGWVAGYDTTVSVSLGTFSATGSDQVQASLSALQSDDTIKTYEGTYTVSGGVIVAASIVQTG